MRISLHLDLFLSQGKVLRSFFIMLLFDTIEHLESWLQMQKLKLWEQNES